MSESNQNKSPTADPAERNTFFPSPYSLSQLTSSRSDLADANYPDAYRSGSWKILVIGADERYLLADNETLFSTGNHPIETLLPMHHLGKARLEFEFEIATLSGNPVKFEWWAFPDEDQEIQRIHAKYEESFLQPHRLTDVIANKFGDDSD